MGKGDKKSRRGKIHIGSYGVRRSRKPGKPSIQAVSKVEEPAKKPKAKATEKPKPVKTEVPVAQVESPQVEVAAKPAAKKTSSAKSTAKKTKAAEPPVEEAG